MQRMTDCSAAPHQLGQTCALSGQECAFDILPTNRRRRNRCHDRSLDALQRFSQQANGLSLAHLDTHPKEVQNLASDLQSHLRRVAYALEEVGSTAPQN